MQRELGGSPQILFPPFPLGVGRTLFENMAKNRMTFEKHQRDAVKKRKAEEKRASKQKKKLAQSEPQSADETPSLDESAEV
ncbi:MAG: hypothetical protein O3C40_07450 [Planctomycetota bacterium]|nr:hypothetical protein [Planctomycetota bacterium]